MPRLIELSMLKPGTHQPGMLETSMLQTGTLQTDVLETGTLETGMLQTGMLQAGMREASAPAKPNRRVLAPGARHSIAATGRSVRADNQDLP